MLVVFMVFIAKASRLARLELGWASEVSKGSVGGWAQEVKFRRASPEPGGGERRKTIWILGVVCGVLRCK